MTRAPTIWHVGQVEPAPGGMSQVIRAYLGWPSFATTQRGVASHGDGSWPRRLALFARALATVATRPSRRHDVVVCHLSEGGSFVREGAVLLLARLRGVATVAQLHGSRFVEFAERHPALVGAVLRRARRALALNAETAAMARAVAPGLVVTLLPNAVDPAPRRDTEALVVFGGEVGPRKGADLLVRAWRDLDDRRGHRLVFAGPIVDEAVVDRAAPDVDYLGAIPHDELLALLDRARVACLPSYREGLPMFVLEAMARWTCVVATRVGGTPQALADGAGMLVDAGDLAALTRALSAATTDGAWEEHAVRAHARVTSTYAADVVFPRVEREWLAARDGAAR
ncbi:glycosyltransferase family 4 protein [Microbacterium sp. No. 7]|uniref:glycosyltransferase family 4 protein n=1 Tax=Microbacterium sp. No. 7 TaxID=1714373 RepID=UPI0006D0C7EB|nr:glycosyltransferase family 4 protein [Microbacterium sp. No. 7]